MKTKKIENILENLLALYISHKEVDLNIIGKLNRLKERVYEAAKEARGVVVLSTCNRFEVYLDSAEKTTIENITDIFKEVGVQPIILRGVNVIKRLLRISTGIESKIIGEQEILGQVREAWFYARKRGTASPLLNMIFHQAIVTGKNARKKTGIAQGNASYPSAAVSLVFSKIGTLDNKRIAIYGAGKAGRAILRIICNKYIPSEIVIITRNPEKAQSSINAICSEAKIVSRREAVELGFFDAIFVATENLEKPGDIENMARIIVDLSTPPSIRSKNTYNIEDLDKVVADTVEKRRKWIKSVEELIEHDLTIFINRLKQRSVSRLLKVVIDYADRLACIESVRRVNSAKNSTDTYMLLKSYSKKLLHPLVMSLRETSSSTWRLEELIEILETQYSRKLKELEKIFESRIDKIPCTIK